MPAINTGFRSARSIRQRKSRSTFTMKPANKPRPRTTARAKKQPPVFRPPAAANILLQLFYEGNVQGVGFRWTVRHLATGFEVTGSVRNLADGRVEMQVNGEESEV